MGWFGTPTPPAVYVSLPAHRARAHAPAYLQQPHCSPLQVCTFATCVTLLPATHDLHLHTPLCTCLALHCYWDSALAAPQPAHCMLRTCRSSRTNLPGFIVHACICAHHIAICALHALLHTLCHTAFITMPCQTYVTFWMGATTCRLWLT